MYQYKKVNLPQTIIKEPQSSSCRKIVFKLINNIPETFDHLTFNSGKTSTEIATDV